MPNTELTSTFKTASKYLLSPSSNLQPRYQLTWVTGPHYGSFEPQQPSNVLYKADLNSLFSCFESSMAAHHTEDSLDASEWPTAPLMTGFPGLLLKPHLLHLFSFHVRAWSLPFSKLDMWFHGFLCQEHLLPLAPLLLRFLQDTIQVSSHPGSLPNLAYASWVRLSCFHRAFTRSTSSFIILSSNSLSFTIP